MLVMLIINVYNSFNLDLPEMYMFSYFCQECLLLIFFFGDTFTFT